MLEAVCVLRTPYCNRHTELHRAAIPAAAAREEATQLLWLVWMAALIPSAILRASDLADDAIKRTGKLAFQRLRCLSAAYNRIHPQVWGSLLGETTARKKAEQPAMSSY